MEGSWKIDHSKIRMMLKEEFSIKNIHEIPRLDKIVLNIGAGEAVFNHKCLESITKDLTTMSGQCVSIRKAKKSIAGFKLREGMPIGAMVTLRSKNMENFLYRFVNIAIPRIRDFKGLSKNSFDVHGNFTFGIKEQIIFPEIQYDKIDKIRGLAVTFVTSSTDKARSQSLLKKLGLPFRE